MRKNHKRHYYKHKTDSGGCAGGVKILLANLSGERIDGTNKNILFFVLKNLMVRLDFVENRIII